MIFQRFDAVRRGVIYHAWVEEIGTVERPFQLRVLVEADDGRQYHTFGRYYRTQRAAMKQLKNLFQRGRSGVAAV